MRALLILNKKNGHLRLMVRLEDHPAGMKVCSLLKANRCHEAFELLKNEAQIDAVLPAEGKLSSPPELILME